jgi:VCBS repeat-containing protein
VQRANIAAARSALTPTLPTIAAPSFIDTLRALPGALISGVLNAVASALASLIGPGAPLDNPSLWGALVLLRRQFDQAYANHTPIATPVQTGQDLGNGQVHGTFGASDPDGDALTYTVPANGAGAPVHGTVTVDQLTGTWTYTPNDNGTPFDYGDDYTGTDSFAVIVSDANAGSHIHAVGATHAVVAWAAVEANGVAVNPENQLPVPPAVLPARTVDHSDGTVVSTIGWTDPDGDVLRYYSSSQPSATTWTSTTARGGTVTVTSTGTYTYTPEVADRLNAYTHPDQGADTFSVVVTDGRGGTQTIDVHVDIDPTDVSITRTASAALPSDILNYNRSAGSDGTVAFSNSTLVSGTANQYETTVIVVRPGAVTPIAVTIAGNSNGAAQVGADGTVAQTTFVYTGDAVNPYAMTVTVLRPGATTPLTMTATGRSVGSAIVSAHGTVTFVTYTRSTSAVETYQVTVTRLSSGAATPIMGTITSTLSPEYNMRVGADGTVAVHTAVTGSGTAADPFQNTVAVFRPGAAAAETTTVTGSLSTKVYDDDDESWWVWADGTVALITATPSGVAGNTDLTTVTLLRPGAALPDVTTFTGPAGHRVLAGDGSLVLTTSTGSGSSDDPYQTTVTMWRPGLAVPTATTVIGQPFWGTQVGADGTVALTTNLPTDNDADPNHLTVTVLRPGGETAVSATTVGWSSISLGFPLGNYYFGPALVDGAGVVTLVTVVYSGEENNIRFTVLRAGADTFDTLTVPYGLPWSPAQVGADGTVATLTLAPSGSGANSWQTFVSVLRPGAAAAVTTSVAGVPVGGLQMNADGTVVLRTLVQDDIRSYLADSLIAVAPPPSNTM